MTKYLFYTENHVFGGGNNYMIDLMNALKSSSNKIVLYCNKKGFFPQDRKKANSKIKVNFIRVFNLNILRKLNVSNIILNKFIYFICILLEPWYILLNIAFFIPYLIRENPNKVIVCNGGYPAALSCLSMVFASKICKIPVLMSIVSMPMTRRKFIAYYDKAIDKLLWFCVDFVIVNCESAKERLHTLRDLSCSKIDVIYNAIINKNEFSGDAFQKSIVTIGFISRIDINKGIFVLLESFKVLRNKYNNIQLLIVGEGSSLKSLQKKTIEYHLENDIQFLGFYDGDILNLIQQKIDIFVLPSFWEGLPYSLIEASSCGRAIIATDVGGVKEVIQNHYSGILVSPRSEIELSTAIEFFLQDPEAAKKMGLHARQVYEEKFKLDMMQNKVRKLLGKG